MKMSIGIVIITLGWVGCSLAKASAPIDADEQYKPAMTHILQWGGAEYYTEPVTLEAVTCKKWLRLPPMGGELLGKCICCWDPKLPMQGCPPGM